MHRMHSIRPTSDLETHEADVPLWKVQTSVELEIAHMSEMQWYGGLSNGGGE